MQVEKSIIGFLPNIIRSAEKKFEIPKINKDISAKFIEMNEKIPEINMEKSAKTLGIIGKKSATKYTSGKRINLRPPKIEEDVFKRFESGLSEEDYEYLTSGLKEKEIQEIYDKHKFLEEASSEFEKPITYPAKILNAIQDIYSIASLPKIYYNKIKNSLSKWLHENGYAENIEKIRRYLDDPVKLVDFLAAFGFTSFLIGGILVIVSISKYKYEEEKKIINANVKV